MIAAVQGYVAQVLSALVPTNYPPPVVSIQSPTDSPSGTPNVVIHDTTSSDIRWTPPRGGGTGLRKMTHNIDLSIVVTQPANAADADYLFPEFLDTVIDALQAVVMPFTITDDLTFVSTYIISFAEQITSDYSWESFTPKGAQMLRLYSGKVSFKVVEQISA